MTREEQENTDEEYYYNEILGYPPDESPEQLAYEMAHCVPVDIKMGGDYVSLEELLPVHT